MGSRRLGASPAATCGASCVLREPALSARAGGRRAVAQVQSHPASRPALLPSLRVHSARATLQGAQPVCDIS